MIVPSSRCYRVFIVLTPNVRNQRPRSGPLHCAVGLPTAMPPC